MTIVQIPPEIRAAALSGGGLTEAVARISATYRDQPGRAVLLSATEKRAYLAVRLPATYAAVTRVLERFRAAGGHSPNTVLDVGCGPGTASLAAAAAFDAIDAVTRSDIDASWRPVAEALGAASGYAALSPGRWLTGSADRTAFPVHDLVIAAYALNEVPEAARPAAVLNLWSAADQTLVLVEPGTPKGFLNIRMARDTLLAKGAHVAAPCTHHGECPMSESDWCHNPVRLARDSAHREAKSAPLSYEDEKFAYLAVTRAAVGHRQTSRIVKHPAVHSGHVRLDLCGDGGMVRTTISRRDGDAYKAARKANWGDSWPPQDQED